MNRKVAFSLIITMFVISVHGQSGKELDEVVVTAQKKEEKAQKIPVSISVISFRQVNEYRLWNSKDLSGIIPNLYSANPGDNRNVTSLRGVATTSYDPTVATYIDGVNQFGLDTYIARLFDVERIEVLRGPQGTLYGRNAMGGVINIITRQPENNTKGYVAMDIGNYGEQRYSFGVRTPLVKDRLLLGVAGLYGSGNGFYTNTFNSSKFDKQNNLTGNYYLKYLANQRISFTLNVKHDFNQNQGPFTLATNQQQALEQPYQLNQDAVSKMLDNNFNSSFSIRYSGKCFDFSSQTSYQSNYRYYTNPLDGDFSPLDAITIFNNYGKDWNKVKAYIEEFRFTSPATSKSPLQWVTGIYSFYQYNPVKQGTHFGKDGGLYGAPFPFFSDISSNIGRSRGIAFFGQGTYMIAPNIQSTLGIRYDYERKSQSIEGFFQMDGQQEMVTRTDTSSKASFHSFSPKANIMYQFLDNHNIYLSYSKGFRAGGISQLLANPKQPPLYNYEPEYSNNIEIGNKNTFFENRLRVNLTAFYTRIKNAQVPTLILPSAVTITQNAGKLTSKGVEAELALLTFHGLEVNYNFGYTDARFTDLTIVSDGINVQQNGNRQVFTPDVTSMLALQYEVNLSKPGKLKLIGRSEWKHMGRQYFDLANQIDQAAYNILNAKIGVSASRFDAYLWGGNLNNERYIDYAYDFGASHLGNPKTYGLSLDVRY